MNDDVKTQTIELAYQRDCQRTLILMSLYRLSMREEQSDLYSKRMGHKSCIEAQSFVCFGYVPQ